MNRDAPEEEDKKSGKKSSKKLIDAAKYSGLAFQLLAAIVVAVLLGSWIDKLLELEKPIFTALLIPVFLFGFIYKLYLDINKNS